MASTTSSTGTVLSGLASGIDWTSLINSMVAAERAPETQWNSQITTLNNQNAAYQTLGNDLSKIQTDVSTLTDPSFFESRTTSVSDPVVASATADSGTAIGTYSLDITRLATAASQNGSAVTAQPISSTDDVSGIQLGSSAFANPITAGSFTVNGRNITVSLTDSLQSVLNQINTATNGSVIASYDTTSDTITLQSSSPITLGSAADTSNFLSATGLFNNGTGTISSQTRLGAINIYANAASSGLNTPITDGGSGNGSFTINGVTINFNASSDSINEILARINASAAGVTASYDSVNHTFSLTNNTTGNVGISLSDGTGSNFLAATGLLSGSFSAGADLQYSINGSGTLTSNSNTISGAAAGITGLSITAQDTGSTTVTVGADTTTIANAITSFVNDYNAAQSYISSQTATTTDSNGNTVPGLLTGDFDIEQISDDLRQMADSVPSGLTGAIQSVTDIGITSNGQNNTFTLDANALNTALTNNISGVQALFSQSGTGLARQLNTYLLNTIGGNGPILAKENSFSSQVTSLQSSITQLESKITMDEASLQNEFVNMEDAIDQSNTDKEYLTAYFSASSASAAPSASSINSGGSSSSSSSSSTNA